jgi:hypothetical protein
MDDRSQSGLDTKCIPLLIQIGGSENYDELESSFPKEKTDEYLRQLNWRIANFYRGGIRDFSHYPEFRALSPEQISNLVRALVMAEKKGLTNTGSTTGVPTMIKYLRSLNWAGADDLENWAFLNSNNYYLPFPHRINYGPVSSAREYLALDQKATLQRKLMKKFKIKKASEDGIPSYLIEKYNERFSGE